MSSIKTQLFTTLANRIQQKLNFAPGEELPPIQWVDRDKGQVENWQDFSTIPLPAVLISFQDTEWRTISRNVQQGVIRVRIKLLYEVLGEFFHGAHEQLESLKCYDFEEQLYAALQGFSGAFFTPMDRVASSDDDDHGNVIMFTQEYLTQITDTGAQTAKDYQLVEPDLMVTYKKELPDNPGAPVIKSGFVVRRK